MTSPLLFAPAKQKYFHDDILHDPRCLCDECIDDHPITIAVRDKHTGRQYNKRISVKDLKKYRS